MQAAIQQQTSRCSETTHRRFFWSVGTVLFIVWATIFGIFGSHSVISFFVGFGVLIGWIVGFAVAFTNKTKLSIRDWCRMRRDVDDAMLPQYVSQAIDNPSFDQAPAYSPSYQQQDSTMAGVHSPSHVAKSSDFADVNTQPPQQQTQQAQGVSQSIPQQQPRPTRTPSMDASGEGTPAVQNTQESTLRRIWRSFWVGIMPFAIIALLVGLFLGLFISALPRVVRDNETIFKVSFFCGILFGMLFTFPLVWLLSIMGKLGEQMAKINPAFAAQCDDSQYTTHGKVIRGAGRAIAISGWSSLFFTTMGAALGMLGSVFVGIGQGNGIAICFFIVLIVLGLWGLWRLIKNHRAAKNNANNGNGAEPYAALADGAVQHQQQPSSLMNSSTNPFDYGSSPSQSSSLSASVSSTVSSVPERKSQPEMKSTPVKNTVPLASIADVSTVPGHPEYVRAMTLLFGDQNGQNKQPEEGARLMLSAAQKGHPDAAAQIKTILESTFAGPSQQPSAPMYPTVASLQTPVR